MFDYEFWENNDWGLHNIDRQVLHGTVAVSGDGSRANRFHNTGYRHYLVRSGEYREHTIYVKPERVGYRIDDDSRKAFRMRCTCSWEEPAVEATDSQCSRMAVAVLGAGAVRMGREPVAGVPVVRYVLRQDGERREIALAPQFGCDLMEEQRVRYNLVGIPTSRLQFVVRSYVLGEPDRRELVPPTGYEVRDAIGELSRFGKQ